VPNTIDLEFADGSYTFALPLERIDELQRKTGVGIGALFGRVTKGAQSRGGDVYLVPGQAEFYALDLIETVRQGLIGGKKGVVDSKEVEVTPIIARRLVDNYLLNQPLTAAWELAVAILGACVMGYDPPGEAPPPGEAATESETTTAG
jgi:hypothetical protein